MAPKQMPNRIAAGWWATRRRRIVVWSGLWLSMALPAWAGEAEPGACRLAAPSLARLGYAGLPVALGRSDLKALKQAGKAVARKDWASARKLLDPLTATYSENPEVRFLLAAVHASTGALDDACSEVVRVLEMDLPAFAQRFEKEPAMASLRASPDGARLAEHAKAVQTLWRKAEADGLPSVMSRGSRGSQEIWFSRYLRGGVYLHDVGRFLPVEAGAEGASGVLVRPKSSSALVAKMKVVDCRDDYCPHITAIDVRNYHLDDPTTPTSRWHYDGQNAHRLDLRASADGVSARVHDCAGPCAWQPVGKKPPSPSLAAEDELTMQFDVRGWQLSLVPAGQQIRKGRLVSATGEVALSERHASPLGTHEIFVDAKTGLRLVLTTLDGCNPKNPEIPILRHVLSKVEPNGKATVLLEGAGPAAALLDGRQAFYLQTGDTVRRWPELSAVGNRPGEPIMPGVLVVVSISPDSSCGGL
jgi:hypothetical protein